MPRDSNKLTDWLTRVARAHQATIDLTSACKPYLPSEAPPLPHTTGQEELLAGVGKGATGKKNAGGTTGGIGKSAGGAVKIRGGVAKRKAIKHNKLAPDDVSKCNVCGYREVGLPRCWGCNACFHPLCLGVK